MLESFMSSWELFHNTYLVGWLIGILLSIVGVLVVARDQIFLGAAVSQSSTLGIAAAMSLGGLGIGPAWFETDAFAALMAVLFCVIASLVTWQEGSGKGRESHEAKTGWVFLLASSFSILLMSHSPHGLEEIHRLVSSSIIGATDMDVWILGMILLLTVLFLSFYHQPILLLSMDPAMAVAVGMKLRLWSVLLSIWLGLSVGLSIRVSGMLYAFGCLVLPPLIAKNVCREVRPMFLVAPCAAVLIASAGFVVAHHYDYPPAQMTVALMSMVLLLCWLKGSLSISKG